MPSKRAPEPYAAPLNQLLTLGAPDEDGFWRDRAFADYCALGIGPEHVPELLRMLRDHGLADGPDPACFGPPHAARALAVLQPAGALLALFDYLRWLDKVSYDYWLEDMPGVLAAFGPDGIPAIAACLRDQRERFGVRLYLIDALERIALQHPEARPRVLSVFRDMLAYAQYTDPSINGHVIGTLVELNATEMLPLIREAYAAGDVAAFAAGSLEEVEAEIHMTADERRQRMQARIDQFHARTDDEGPSGADAAADKPAGAASTTA